MHLTLSLPYLYLTLSSILHSMDPEPTVNPAILKLLILLWAPCKLISHEIRTSFLFVYLCSTYVSICFLNLFYFQPLFSYCSTYLLNFLLSQLISTSFLNACFTRLLFSTSCFTINLSSASFLNLFPLLICSTPFLNFIYFRHLFS